MTSHLEVIAPPATELLRCGAELVDLVETYYVRVFALALNVLLCTVAVSLAMTPLRPGHSDPAFTLAVLGVLACAGVGARCRALESYRELRSHPSAVVAVAAIFALALGIDDPVTSPLWWVAFGVLAVCTVAGDGHSTSLCAAVVVVGFVLGLAWHDHLDLLGRDPRLALQAAGFPFWALLLHGTIAGIARCIMRIGESRSLESSPPPRVAASVTPPDGSEPSRSVALTRPAPSAGLDPTLQLTARQLEVVVLLCDGYKQREIAQMLAISARHVQRLVRNAKDRLRADSSGALVTKAIAAGLVPAKSRAGAE